MAPDKCAYVLPHTCKALPKIGMPHLLGNKGVALNTSMLRLQRGTCRTAIPSSAPRRPPPPRMLVCSMHGPED